MVQTAADPVTAEDTTAGEVQLVTAEDTTAGEVQSTPDPTSAAWDALLSADERHISRHHLDSYDAFVKDGMRRTISKFNPISIFHHSGLDAQVFIGGESGDEVTIHPPTALPHACRENDITYACDVTVNILVKFQTQTKVGDAARINKGVLEKRFTDVRLFRLPAMVRSSLCLLAGQTTAERQVAGECKFDQGGYFIVGGMEKVVIAQTRNANNRLFVVVVDCSDSNFSNYSHRAWLRSATTDTSAASAPKTIEFFKYRASKASRKSGQAGTLSVKLPALSRAIPLFVLFRALGIESDLAIVQHILHNSVADDDYLAEHLRPSVLQSLDVQSQSAALDMLRKMTRSGNHTYYVQPGRENDEVLMILRDDVFPTAGSDLSLKAHFLGAAVEQFLKTTLDILPVENRDHMRHQRVDVSGMLFADLFRDAYTTLVNHIKSKTEAVYMYGFVKNTKEFLKMINPSNQSAIFDHTIVTERFVRALKGRWLRGQPSNEEKYAQGVAQELNRIAYMNTINSLRRVAAPLDPTSKMAPPRRLQGSQWGYLCPCESPDGANVGLINHLALACRVTHPDAELDAQVELMLLAEAGVHALAGIPPWACGERARVLLNDVWLAVCDEPAALLERLLSRRRTGELSPWVSLCWHIASREVRVHTDGGRCCRPLMVCKDGVVTSTVEYLDAEETETAMIAMYARDVRPGITTHAEIHPSLMFGVIAANLPLLEHNPSVRGAFAYAHAKHSVGMYATNFRRRFDKAAYVLNYPQRNLVTTRASRFLHMEEMGYGQNLVVAIAVLTGYNTEDAIIINRAAVQRGLLDATYFKTVVVRESEDTDGPSTTVRVSFGQDGMPQPGTVVREGDTLVTRNEERTMRFRDTQWDQASSTTESRDVSVAADKTMDCTVVDRVHVCGLGGKLQTCKIRLRQPRPPSLGDKMGSRHGQKGVVGAMMSAENLPYSQGGLVPDIIINPHGFPSRMTIAQLLESVIGKACCAGGFLADGTPFQECDSTAFADVLEQRYGYERFGHELLYDGHTGLQMEANVFVGPTYYQRLKHMVADKINHRSYGAMVGQTHQPTQGRDNGGGQRIGEMEENALLGHGALAFLKESFIDRSDGTLLGVDAAGKFVEKGQASVEGRVVAPYAVKLLTQELETLSIRAALVRSDGAPHVDGDNDYDSDIDDSDNERETADYHAWLQCLKDAS